jgi:uncharacterized protein YjiS (DUF1127 family)
MESPHDHDQYSGFQPGRHFQSGWRTAADFRARSGEDRGRGLGALIETPLDWQERARQRSELLALAGRTLQDFGA